MLATIDPAEAVKARLRQLGMSQGEFSKRVGKSPGWAGARFLPSVDTMMRYLAYREPQTLERILSVLEWTPEQFTRATGVRLPPFVIIPDSLPVRRYRIPIVDAGAGLPAWNEGGEFIVLDLPELRGKSESELFAVRVVGDSMSPTYLNGDVVVIWTQGQPETGKVVAVHQGGDGIVLKRLQHAGGHAVLYSDNPAYPPIPMGEHDRIAGVALGMWRPAR